MIAGSIWLLLGAVLYYTSPELYDHLHLLHQTVFIIMIGYCCGKKVRTDMPVPLSGVVAIFIVCTLHRWCSAKLDLEATTQKIYFFPC